jgi:hypothetical protein
MARSVPAAIERLVPRGLRTRVEQARGRLKGFQYMQESAAGVVDRVLCKVCGSPIAGLVVHEQPVEIRRESGRVLVKERLVMAQFSNYAAITLEFADGSTHETPLCTTCIPTLTAEQAEDAYAADVEDLLLRGAAERVRWDRWQRTLVKWTRSG